MRPKVSLEEREEILNREVVEYARGGYRLTESTRTMARMFRPRQSYSRGSCVMGILTFGLWLVIEPLFRRRWIDRTVLIYVDERGKVSRKKRF